MKSTEEMSIRLEYVKMHEFFLNRIDISTKEERYIEASWIIYSCFENRYFRTIEKLKKQCKYSGGKCKKPNNELALRTKIRCLQRLHTAKIQCIYEAFDHTLFDKTLEWVKNRNILMHNLLKLEDYTNVDLLFKQCSLDGRELLRMTYESTTKFRSIFYSKNHEFNFPVIAMEGCSCKPQKQQSK